MDVFWKLCEYFVICIVYYFARKRIDNCSNFLYYTCCCFGKQSRGISFVSDSQIQQALTSVISDKSILQSASADSERRRKNATDQLVTCRYVSNYISKVKQFFFRTYGQNYLDQQDPKIEDTIEDCLRRNGIDWRAFFICTLKRSQSSDQLYRNTHMCSADLIQGHGQVV
jgi:hypothetical protein